jgi:hypothetical protein
MDRIIGFLMFFSVFLVVYLGMHYYVFWRFAGFFGVERDVWFYVVLLCLAFSFIAASMTERFFDGLASRVFYTVSSVWLGALFYFVCVLAVYEVLKYVVKLDPRITAFTIVGIVLTLVIYGLLNAYFIQVREIEVPMPYLEKEVTIAQISDVHIGTIHKGEFLSRIAGKINALKPDMVMITGDLFDGSGLLAKSSFAPLDDIEAKTFFTTGNHEMYEGVESVMSILKDTKVIVLRDEVVEYKGIQVVGVDNPEKEMSRKNSVLSGLDIKKGLPTVLMFHQPNGVDDAVAAGIHLQLSGHTHNGQIMPFNIMSKLFYPKVHGLYDLKGMFLYVSPGTGTWGPPMRVGSSNEITLIRLVKAV